MAELLLCCRPALAHDRDVNEPVLSIDLPFAKRLGRGKVREIFELNGDLLLVASDRVSAFDVVMR